MSKYEQLGVSPHKPDVHAAISGLQRGVYPLGFCVAVPDVFTQSSEHCLLVHSDGAGTKSALAYVVYRDTKDASVFRGIAQDSLVMNLDDLLCVGATGPFVFSNTIGRNIHNAPGDVISEIIHGYEAFAAVMRENGVEIHSCGGETADLGDLVRTIIVDSTVVTRVERRRYIDCGLTPPGKVIVGFESSGQATYETVRNSGIGTNGFTSARHNLLSNRYAKRYPETFAPEIQQLAYRGNSTLDDPVADAMTIRDALLSPTRTYAPIMIRVLKEYPSAVHSVFHNTGGGLTKCLTFGKGIRYVKDNLFEPPPDFQGHSQGR